MWSLLRSFRSVCLTTMSLPLSMQIMRRSWCVQWPAWTCRFSDTQLSVTYQASSPVRESDRTYLTSLSPLPPSLPGCPSTLGPPWEDASPNPNQVTNMFPYASVGSRSGKFQRTLPQNKQLFAGGEQYVVLCMLWWNIMRNYCWQKYK